MFKDEEVHSKFNNKKTAKFAKSSIVAMIFEIGQGGAIAKWGYYRTAGANHKRIKNL